jgi:hypothetical protein
MCGDKFTKEVSSIYLSNNVIKRRIDETAKNIKSTLIEPVRSSENFALQQDESSDISTSANLLFCEVRI